MGFEARAWWFDDESNHFALTNDGTTSLRSAAPLGLRNTSTTAGDVLTYDSSLDIDVLDLIGTYRWGIGAGTIDLGGGVRYAKVQQNITMSRRLPAAPPWTPSIRCTDLRESARL